MVGEVLLRAAESVHEEEARAVGMPSATAEPHAVVGRHPHRVQSRPDDSR